MVSVRNSTRNCAHGAGLDSTLPVREPYPADACEIETDGRARPLPWEKNERLKLNDVEINTRSRTSEIVQENMQGSHGSMYFQASRVLKNILVYNHAASNKEKLG